MKNIYVACIAAFFLSMEACWAQAEFHFAFGLGPSIATAKKGQGGFPSRSTDRQANLMVRIEPRVVFYKPSTDISLSLNATPSFAAFSYNSNIQGKASFYYEIPLSLELNLMNGATYDYDGSGGFFLGAGYGICNPNVGKRVGSPEISQGY